MLLTKEVIRKAKEILGPKGENRIKGVYYDMDNPKYFCMIGALAKAINEDYPKFPKHYNLAFNIFCEIKDLTNKDGWRLNDDNEWDVVNNFLNELESKLTT